jgi:hypothetical protein
LGLAGANLKALAKGDARIAAAEVFFKQRDEKQRRRQERKKEGGRVKAYVCLLDRESVWPQMILCDRYEPREDLETPPDT